MQEKGQKDLKNYLEALVDRFNRPAFISTDPISIPHSYTRRQDIEIAGFIAATFAWGQRKTIIAKAGDFLSRMGHRPYEFILDHREQDREAFLDFRHRTFQATDALYFLDFLQRYYRKHTSLEEAFLTDSGDFQSAFDALHGFHRRFFDVPYAPQRTAKHLPDPGRKSTCKRLNMFLRWMVRQDDRGVDFGLWQRIDPAALHMPLDVHVETHARRLGLLVRRQRDWGAVAELTERLRTLDPADPVRYDFALFGLGILQKETPPFEQEVSL